MMTLRDDLIAAKALIKNPTAWVKDQGDCINCWCAATACGTVSGDDIRARFAMWDSLKKQTPDRFDDVADFNDDPATTHADVMALFDRAIASATWHVIKCDGCGARVEYPSLEGAIATWNSRSPELTRLKARADAECELKEHARLCCDIAEAKLATAREALERMKPHVRKIRNAVRINNEMGLVVIGQTEAAVALSDEFDTALRSISEGDPTP